MVAIENAELKRVMDTLSTLDGLTLREAQLYVHRLEASCDRLNAKLSEALDLLDIVTRDFAGIMREENETDPILQRVWALLDEYWEPSE